MHLLTGSIALMIHSPLKLAYQVVGSAATLKSDPLWKNLVESAEQRNRLFKVKIFFPFVLKVSTLLQHIRIMKEEIVFGVL